MDDGAGRNFPDLRVLDGDLGTGVRYAITSRERGASRGTFAYGNLADHVGDDPVAVEINRRSLSRALRASQGLAVIEAVHGDDVAWATAAGSYANVDALVTDSVGVGLVALGADCSVIGIGAITSDGIPIAGVAHCGWRGLVADVVGAVVTRITSAGGRQLRAVIGPTICGSCYRVDADRREEVLNRCSPGVAAAAVGQDQAAASAGLDVRSGVRRRLEELGVDVVADVGCTAEDDRWFSHRATVERAGPRARTGRHGLAVVIDRVQPRTAKET